MPADLNLSIDHTGIYHAVKPATWTSNGAALCGVSNPGWIRGPLAPADLAKPNYGWLCSSCESSLSKDPP